MDNQELKVIMSSLYGFTATQLVQQVSAINALERTLEDIKKGASWNSLDLCLESAISTLEAVKNTTGINSERSENLVIAAGSSKQNNTNSKMLQAIDSRTKEILSRCNYIDSISAKLTFLRDFIAKVDSERNTPGINSECSKLIPLLNIDRIRTMTAKELAHTLAHRYFVSCTEDVYEWLMSEYTGFDREDSERSEKEDD